MRKVEFQKRHFEFLARTLKELKDEAKDTEQADRVIEHFADALRATNPNFDHDRFMAAAGHQ